MDNRGLITNEGIVGFVSQGFARVVSQGSQEWARDDNWCGEY